MQGVFLKKTTAYRNVTQAHNAHMRTLNKAKLVVRNHGNGSEHSSSECARATFDLATSAHDEAMRMCYTKHGHNQREIQNRSLEAPSAVMKV